MKFTRLTSTCIREIQYEPEDANWMLAYLLSYCTFCIFSAIISPVAG